MSMVIYLIGGGGGEEGGEGGKRGGGGSRVGWNKYKNKYYPFKSHFYSPYMYK